jgi:lipopolysaccharide export system permease protein
LTFSLNSYIIPKSNIRRIEFRNQYIKDKETKTQSNNQFMVEPGVVAYFNYYDKTKQTGTGFALEKFEDRKLVSRLTARKAVYQGDYLWHITDYQIRTIDDRGETLEKGTACDSLISIAPQDIIISKNDCEKMTTPELHDYIQKQQFRGVGNIKDFEIEYHKRWAAIAASFILTLIGVSLSSRKVKGGMGVNIGIGLALSFIYILFQTVSSTFAVSGEMSVLLAVWLPNIVFAGIAYYLYLKAPR